MSQLHLQTWYALHFFASRSRRMALCALFFLDTLLLVSGGYADELADRFDIWRSQAFICKGAAPLKFDAFPSKFNANDSEQCDDGDMTLFNGLLRLSGEQLGCEAVRQAQDSEPKSENYGRWWRSPRRVGWEHPKHDVSFSPDQALGVLSYTLATHDTTAFDRWLSWIVTHRAKLTSEQIKEVAKDQIAKLHWQQWQIDLVATLIANLLPERLSYCSDDYDARCTLRPGDCALIKNVAMALGRNVDICGSYLFFSKIEEAFEQAGVFMPQALAVASSYFNDDNYPLHLAAVQVLLRQKMGDGASYLTVAASSKLNCREPRNPFFAFLAGKLSGAYPNECDKLKPLPQLLGARDLLLKQCLTSYNPPSQRNQWAWERPDAEQAWLNTMYWDCIFVGKLIQ